MTSWGVMPHGHSGTAGDAEGGEQPGEGGRVRVAAPERPGPAGVGVEARVGPVGVAVGAQVARAVV
jgi:hypothetical protein